jgi:hypothetical protein
MHDVGSSDTNAFGLWTTRVVTTWAKIKRSEAGIQIAQQGSIRCRMGLETPAAPAPKQDVSMTLIKPLVFSTFVALAAGCASDVPEVEPGAALDEDYGKTLYGVDDTAAGKADSFDGVAGPRVAGLSATTEVWKVNRRWYETDAAAGIAWPANSTLTWDEKFAAWVDSLAVHGEGYTKTFKLSTPWGKTLPAPRLECAETAMFLRATFEDGSVLWTSPVYLLP